MIAAARHHHARMLWSLGEREQALAAARTALGEAQSDPLGARAQTSIQTWLDEHTR